MKRERWQQIKALLQAALEHAPDERPGFLAAACNDDESLRAEVQKLIVSHDQAGPFIEEPAFGVLAESLVGKAAEETLTGQRLGHYAIGKQLGKGGMGEVYQAEDTRLGRNVALKLLPALFTTEVERVRRFQQEARAASALNHPNILTIYEIGEIDSRRFMTTELVEGVTLRQQLTKGRMEISEILEVAMQTASALAAAHDSGIIHRDIKPENIMLRRDGILKVLDFGLAKLLERPSVDAGTNEILSTRSGTIMGTTHYMSPEQTRGLRVDERTDIWSFGVLLYEMIGMRVPFTGDTSSDVIVSILEKKAPPLARLRPETPAALQRVVNKALRKDQNRRYQNARAVLTDLEEIKRSLTFATAARRSDQRPSPRKRTAHASRRLLDSIAVLPLVNAGGDAEMEYLSDGVTENIIDNISQLPALRVMAWGTVARYRGLGAAPNEIGRALGVRTVLNGSLRHHGDRLIVRTELVDTSDGACLWSVRYDQSIADIFSMQEEIAREISQKLRLKLSGEDRLQLARRQTENVDAYRAYLKGRYYWNKRATEWLKKGADYFRQAIDLDPNYAAAYAGLSDSYTLLVVREAMPPETGFTRAKAAAARALEIDEDFAQAHASLGHAMLHNWEWVKGEQELQRAIRLNPGYPSAHHWYSEHLTAMGRCDESITELKLAAELDPLSLIISADLGRAFYYARQYGDVFKQEAQTLEMDSNFWLSHINLGRAYLQTGDHSQAIRELQQARKLSAAGTEALSFLGFAYAAAGKTDEARQALAELNDESRHEHVPPYHLAIVHAGLGEKEKAFEYLERAFEKHSVDLFTLKVEPMLDSLRGDPRFNSLLRRTGLAPAEQFSRVQSSLKSPVHRRTSRKAIRSLAIMPFVNASADPNLDYLSDGLTESIINSLSQLPKLRVVARNTVFRYKGQEVEPIEVGHLLDVQTVVTGRVRQVGDHLNIGAELIAVDTNAQLWGETYNCEFSDVLELQADIARQIAEQLRLKLTGSEKDRLSRRYTENHEAYRLYLQGRYHWNQRSTDRLQKGLECFQQAIAIDPTYSLAYAGVSDCHAFQGDVGLSAIPPKDAFSLARQAAIQALRIDPTLSEAYVSLAHANMHRFEWAEAETAFKKAIKFNPGNIHAHQWYAFFLLFNGEPDQAIGEARRAVEIDPLSLHALGDLAQMFHFTRQYHRAIEIYQQALDLEPNRYRAFLWLGLVYQEQQRYEEAIAAFEKASSEDNTEPLAALGCVYALSGRNSQARAVLKQLNQIATNRYVSPYYFSLLHMNLGDDDNAFTWLERAYEERAAWMTYLSVDPRFDRLRANPRFVDLLKRIGFRPS